MTIGKLHIKRAAALAAALLLFGGAGRAQQVEFEADAPRRVEAGVPFRIEFTANAEVEEFTPPAFPEQVGLIAGPSTSHGQRIVFVGGRSSHLEVYTYTYLLRVERPGRVTIPEATVRVEGREYRSRPIMIEAGDAPAAAGGDTPEQPAALAADDILLRVVADRTTVYRGEPVRVSYKIYAAVGVNSIHDIRTPAFDGFWTQEIPTGNQRTQEVLNNKLYDAMAIREFLLIPQQAGTLTIAPMTLQAVARIVSQPREQSLMDEFYGGGPAIRDIPKEVGSGPLRITVRDWPAGAPAGFDGAVGRFTLQGGPGRIEIPAGAAASYDLKISGTGNLPLVSAPAVELPGSFEQYPVETTDGFNVSGGTLSGGKEFTIPFIARGEGEFTIPPVEFVYFDPQAESYRTLSTPDYTVRVGAEAGGGAGPGLVTGVPQSGLEILGEDIRFIRLGNPGLRPAGTVLLGSWRFWGALLGLIALFLLAAATLRRRIRYRSDATLVRNRRAQKVALRRLKAAERHMLAGDSAGFYEELLRALWGYMSDKLDIPVARLSRDNVREGLFARGVGTELIEKYVATIADCEYARYAPAEKTRIGDVYNAAVELISRMESRV